VNILAIETATQACAVGVRSTIGREVVHVVNDDRRHTEVLTLAMSAILDEVGLEPRDVTPTSSQPRARTVHGASRRHRHRRRLRPGPRL
jgi:hypothetical protein